MAESFEKSLVLGRTAREGKLACGAAESLYCAWLAGNACSEPRLALAIEPSCSESSAEKGFVCLCRRSDPGVGGGTCGKDCADMHAHQDESYPESEYGGPGPY